MAFLLASENIAFTVSLAVMFGIAFLEGALTLIGVGLSGVLDNLLPDVDIDGPDLDGAAEASGAGALSQFLGWLMIGKVPAMVLLVAFLTSFGLCGLAIQSAADSTVGFLLPGWVASAAAFALALPGTRWVGRGVAKIIPADETSAVSSKEFVGLVATITLGKAVRGGPAQAKLRDRHDLTHYVMVEPDLDDEVFSQGDEVLLVRRTGTVFRAIRNPNRSLTDSGLE